MTLQRESVLFLACDSVLAAVDLRGLAHRVTAPELLHPRVHEAPPDRGVVDLRRAVEGPLCLRHHERRPRHRFTATGDGDLGLFRADLPIGAVHRLEARAAQPVHRGSRDLHRKSREQESHPRDVAVVLAGLVGGAPDNVVDSVVGNAGSFHQGLDSVGREVVGSHGGESAAEPPHRRPHRVDHEDVSHTQQSIRSRSPETSTR